ncbi:MAG: hypothetical protein ACE5E7_06460, partial [Anaerolineae bacterium]
NSTVFHRTICLTSLWHIGRYGIWRIDNLLIAWRNYVQAKGHWQIHEYEGYRPISADITTFWRFRLKGWAGRYFNGIANRLLGGVGLAIVVEIGHIDEHRLPLLRKMMRAHPKDMSQDKLKEMILAWLARHLNDNEVVIFDAGAHINDMQATSIPRFVIRLAKNCTARRNYLPKYKKGRPPEYGKLVRPLARKRKDKTISASSPDELATFTYQGRTIVVHCWRSLVLTKHKVADQHDTFDILVFFDPLYVEPLVLGTNLSLSAEIAFKMYLDRWPVEQVPLSAKQILGLGRHFVFAPESCQRLPELSLLAGNMLTHLAASLPPMPTGFWDRRPKKRLVGYEGSWLRLIFQKQPLQQGNFGKRGQLLSIYPRVLLPIGGENGILDRCLLILTAV